MKAMVGLVLLPSCFGAVVALGRVVRASGGADMVWVPMVGGAGCWLAVFLLLPPPMRMYVLGHELTHAMWTWAFGGRVKRIRVSARGGHVVVTRNNFLITLAPYFFPFYAVLLAAVFGLGHWIWGWAGYRLWFHLLLGAAYGFHVTLTGHILQTRQSDIARHGVIFSGVVIFLGNILVLLVALPVLTSRLTVFRALGWWWTETGAVWHWLAGFAG